jgi:hypothetical protein
MRKKEFLLVSNCSNSKSSWLVHAGVEDAEDLVEDCLRCSLNELRLAAGIVNGLDLLDHDVTW